MFFQPSSFSISYAKRATTGAVGEARSKKGRSQNVQVTAGRPVTPLSGGGEPVENGFEALRFLGIILLLKSRSTYLT
ncbi:hypothetical protein LXL04_037449 [Taraxacum kok-saghyz]